MEHHTVSLFSRELALPALVRTLPLARVSFALTCLAGLFVVYRTGAIIYNLFFHPLAAFPGPLLSRATFWPEFYHDVLRPGLYLYEIEKMHEKYGPVVRVTPDEICIRDALFYENLYSHTRRMNNDPRFMKGNGYDGSHFLTLDHDLHKSRRRVLDPFFSRSGVRKIEPLIQRLAAHFDTRLRQHAGQTVRMDHAFASFTGDVIYFMLATLFRPDGPVMEIYETDESDVRPKHAYMLNLPKLETKGLRVRILAQARTWESMN